MKNILHDGISDIAELMHLLRSPLPHFANFTRSRLWYRPQNFKFLQNSAQLQIFAPNSTGMLIFSDICKILEFVKKTVMGTFNSFGVFFNQFL